MTDLTRKLNDARKLDTPITVALVIILTLSSPIIIYTYMWWISENSKISVKSAELFLRDKDRYIKLTVKSLATQNVSLQTVAINGTIVSINRTILKVGLEKEIILQYYWLAGKTYLLRISTAEGTYSEITATAPILNQRPSFNITSLITSIMNEDSFKISLNYQANFTGEELARVMIFPQKTYQNISRPIYIFNDGLYLPPEV